MASVNKVMLLGCLGQDPKVFNTQSGNKIVTFNLATSETWKDKQSGEKREHTEWHSVVVYSSGLASVAEKYLKKGSKVYLEGQLQTRKYDDKNGVQKYVTEIVLQGFNCNMLLLDSKKEAEKPNIDDEWGESALTNNPDDLEDAIPF